jgi:hypothetical protein
MIITNKTEVLGEKFSPLNQSVHYNSTRSELVSHPVLFGERLSGMFVFIPR